MFSKLTKIFRTTSPDVQLNVFRSFTMCDDMAIKSLYKIANEVKERQIRGDVVECGVCNGGTAAILGSVLKDTGKAMWLYDSFEGMPKTDAIDGTDAAAWVGKCKGSQESVKAALELAKYPMSSAVIRAGWFQETFKQPLPESISILHIDADCTQASQSV
jgi:O-methyltransferase